jgi:4-amino-4-deoxy-L-arabinose transferase-like glycosyltransferase
VNAGALAAARPAQRWRSDTAAVAVALFAWFAATAWMRPLMLPDEGRYVGVAFEMLRTGDWLTPTLDGLPFFHKPPLFYWLTAAAMRAFGPHEWAARMAPLLGGFGGALALYLFLRRWAGASRARLALVVLAVQPLFYVGAQFANLDMLVAGCISATVLGLAHAALCLDAGLPHRRTLLGAYAMAALGVLAKGLIGVVIPALVIGAWLLARRRWRLLAQLVSWPALAFFLALAAPWFIAMQWQHPAFLHYFFVVQHLQRFAGGGFNNVQPFWFYPAVLALCSLPWLPWLAPLAQPAGRDPVRTLMLAWAAVVVLFFSLPASKLVGYVLPALPPLAALMAEGLALALRQRPQAGRWALAGAAVSLMVGLGLVLGLALRPPHSGRDLAHALAQQHGPGEPVIALRPYPYDLAFYARLQAPIVVVDDWAQHRAQPRDDWRKELSDAAAFAPQAGGHTLLPPAALSALLCHAPVSWILAGTGVLPAPLPAGARLVFADHDAALWRVRPGDPGVAAALGCEGTRGAAPVLR